MSKYFDWPASLKRFVRFDAARAEDVNAALDELTAGTDTIEADINRALKLPAGTADQTLALSAGQRANLVLAFDAAGNITAMAGGGRYRGEWAAATAYVSSDYFRDPVSKNIYAVVAPHVSGTLAADIGAGKVRLAISLADVEAERLAAQSAAGLAAQQAATATTQAGIAEAQANAARAIANFVGVWATLTGPLAKPATTLHNGQYYALVNNLADVAASEPGVSADWVPSSALQMLPYDSRGLLRVTSGLFAVVEGLGLFRFAAGSGEPDDDESCFSTGTGCWLLEAVHWDVVDVWNLPDRPGSVLYGTATSSITSVASVTQVSFAGTVTGAATTDSVIATPPDAMGGRVAYFARVTSANTVTVYINNPSAASQTLSTGTWRLVVFKES